MSVIVDRRLPDLGESPLEAAFLNYQAMEQDLAMARAELEQKTSMVNDLLRENEFLRRNYDKAVAERDRYQALAVNLATRAVGVKEAVERLLAEAVSARAAPVADVAVARAAIAEAAGGLTAQMQRVLSGSDEAEWMPEPGVIKRNITMRDTEVKLGSGPTTPLAPVNWN